jgi:hypothetical protein
MTTFWQAAAAVAVLASLTVGIVIGMAVQARTARNRETRVSQKSRAAEHGLQLLIWHTGKSREQLWEDYQFRRLAPIDDEAA